MGQRSRRATEANEGANKEATLPWRECFIEDVRIISVGENSVLKVGKSVDFSLTAGVG